MSLGREQIEDQLRALPEALGIDWAGWVSYYPRAGAFTYQAAA